MKAGRPVTSVYAARTPAVTTRRLAVEEAAFARGERVPGRLYVLLPGAPRPAGLMPLIRTINGVEFIPAASPRSAP